MVVVIWDLSMCHAGSHLHAVFSHSFFFYGHLCTNTLFLYFKLLFSDKHTCLNSIFCSCLSLKTVLFSPTHTNLPLVLFWFWFFCGQLTLTRVTNVDKGVMLTNCHIIEDNNFLSSSRHLLSLISLDRHDTMSPFLIYSWRYWLCLL